MSWSLAVEAISSSVSEISKTISAYGPNDEQKAVRSAKNAGNKAKSLAKKSYPVIETNREFEKKIRPLINGGLLDETVVDRATYNFQRAKVLEDTYNQAYEEVMSLYRQRLENGVNGIQEGSAQDYLVDSITNPNDTISYTKSATSGCLGVSLILILSFAFALTYFITTLI